MSNLLTLVQSGGRTREHDMKPVGYPGRWSFKTVHTLWKRMKTVFDWRPWDSAGAVYGLIDTRTIDNACLRPMDLQRLSANPCRQQSSAKCI